MPKLFSWVNINEGEEDSIHIMADSIEESKDRIQLLILGIYEYILYPNELQWDYLNNFGLIQFIYSSRWDR